VTSAMIPDARKQPRITRTALADRMRTRFIDVGAWGDGAGGEFARDHPLSSHLPENARSIAIENAGSSRILLKSRGLVIILTARAGGSPATWKPVAGFPFPSRQKSA